MNILHITSILPAPLLNSLKENDILLRIAEEYKKTLPGTNHYFILCIPFCNKVLSFFNSRWKEYYELQKKGSYEQRGFKVFVIGIPSFRVDNFAYTSLSKIGFLLNYRKIQKIIRVIEPDLIHAHNFKYEIEISELIRKTWNIDFIASARAVTGGALRRIMEGDVRPRGILALNYISYVNCANTLNQDVFLIPHPVDEGFVIDPSNLRVNRPVKFVSVCRLLSLKNLDKVIIALSSIDEPYTYDIYGEGPELDSLTTLVEKYNLRNKVFFKGWIDHKSLMESLRGYDMLLQPSFPETLGRIYFESLLAGVTVMAARNTGIDGLVKNRYNAFLVNHADIVEIRDYIKEYINLSTESKLEIKERGINFASDFNWKASIEKYEKMYTMALN